jgi:hypothetical protein
MQTPDNNEHRTDETLEASPRLIAALKRLPQEQVFIPRSADEAVLRAAREHLAAGESGTECARPRAQQSAAGLERWGIPVPSWVRTLLRPRTGALRSWQWAAIATAAILLLVAIPRFSKKGTLQPDHGSASARLDVNDDGQVDILDAFALARQLKQGGNKSLQLDVNGDGVVDERDVAVLAARAVKLERGGRS